MVGAALDDDAADLEFDLAVIQHQPFILIQKTTATLKTRTPPELNFRWGYSVSQI